MDIQHRLNETRARLLSTVEGLTDEQLNWKPSDDVWSIAQILEHLVLVESGCAKAARLGLKQERTYVPRDLSLEQTLTDRSRKVNAPKISQPSSEFKSSTELLEQMASTRARLVEMLAGVENADDLNTTSPPVPHPVFGPLSSGQWLTSIVLHEMRHIAQIEERIAQLPSVS